MHLYRISLCFMLLIIAVSTSTSVASPQSVTENVFVLQGDALQTIVLNQSFDQSKEIAGRTVSLDVGRPVFGAGIEADITLFNAASCARVVLIDSDFEEYLLYETYSLLVDNYTFSIKNACRETKLLRSITPVSIRVELLDASMMVRSIVVRTSSPVKKGAIGEWQDLIRGEQEQQMIDLLNVQIKKKGMQWTAGPTSLSSLTYAEKKILFGGPRQILANLQGFEYYAGGIFEYKSNNPEDYAPKDAAPFAVVDTFDWRNRHGATESGSPYYDGDDLGGGWCTSIKDQSEPQYCGSCWAHSTLAAAEVICNLYYNRHLDMDLAEQYLMECSDACSFGNGCNGGSPGRASRWVASHGNIEEASFPYTASNDPECGDSARDPEESLRFENGTTSERFTVEEDLKHFLIQNGPLNVGVSSMNHAMCMVGFTKDRNGNTAWIFKNSHGTRSGNNGYTTIVKPLSDFSITAYDLPPTSNIYDDDSIRCVDLDNDGYYFWGIGPKPATCPQGCSDEEDCDDSRSDLGPMEDDGSCREIATSAHPHMLQHASTSHWYRIHRGNRFAGIDFIVPENARITVRIYDLSGNVIRVLTKINGSGDTQKLAWDGTTEKGGMIRNGVYVCRIETDSGHASPSTSFKIMVTR